MLILAPQRNMGTIVRTVSLQKVSIHCSDSHSGLLLEYQVIPVH